MCILSFLPAGVDVDLEGLLNGGLSNPDGHGWAIADVDNGRIIVGKSLELTEALDTFAEARAKCLNGPALFHSRWATHGSVTTDNVHPFVVGHNPLTVVGHNGILPSGAHPGKGDDRSDTRLFADEILSTRYRRLDKPRAFEALTQWITKGNKLVILTVDPRYRRNAYLVNESVGNWDKTTGIWHSNYDYLTPTKWRGYSDSGYAYGGWYGSGYSNPSKRTTVIGGSNKSRNWQRPATSSCGSPSTATERIDAAREYSRNERCYICEMDPVNALGYCTGCGTCQDCLEPESLCNCWDGSDWELRQGRGSAIAADDADDADVLDESDGDRLTIALAALDRLDRARVDVDTDADADAEIDAAVAAAIADANAERDAERFAPAGEDDDVAAAAAALDAWRGESKRNGGVVLSPSLDVS